MGGDYMVGLGFAPMESVSALVHRAETQESHLIAGVW